MTTSLHIWSRLFLAQRGRHSVLKWREARLNFLGRSIGKGRLARTMLLLIPGLLMSLENSHAETAFDPDLIAQALNKCASMTETSENILPALHENGWEHPELSSREAVGALLHSFASAHFAANHTLESAAEVEYSIHNAHFMAASILGNSAITTDPKPYVQNGEVILGIIGVTVNEPNLPYCIISGPSTLLMTVQNSISLHPAERIQSSQHEHLEGQLGSATIRVLSVNKDEILPQIDVFKASDSTFAANPLREFIRHIFPVTVIISPHRASGEN